jgi:hypothetical protein
LPSLSSDGRRLIATSINARLQVERKGSTLLLESARKRHRYWRERLEAARAARDHHAEATARRYLREYQGFIISLTGETDPAESPKRKNGGS